ncbi:gamma-glutamyltranspeptidase/glutathione hydrolase [Chitinophaga skermanii]|uniref:Glutathione hydrolase proenzyme n=1 Tax=Chitinophaga skermanii TaxID=331697 RepID=A0A327QMJ2_9BACT|nr:gamma-glutamyltransferase [Chitinophaga skermanii]RAJ05258.1 gamma-glutamyltranspeptidase/glutathione hydrolase [Chitinophaga skermanii]
MRNKISAFAICMLIVGTTFAQHRINPYQYSIQKEKANLQATVVSAHPLASEVGTMIMEQGGNAVDAAIATQLALAVVYPQAGNLGGGGFLVAHFKNGSSISVDYRETAPGKASRDMYLDEHGNAITLKSIQGHLAAGVPGTPAGLFAVMPHAKLPFSKLIAPAIALAEKGFAITATEARDLNSIQENVKRLSTQPTAFVKDTPWKAGDTLVQKDLARTLKLMRDKGVKGFYEGETANKIVAEMKRGNGIMTLDDLKHYKAKSRTPISFQYKDYQVITMPLPSSGGIILQQMMEMIAKYPVAQYGHNSPQAVQLMTEIERRAYADRAEFLGDADFVKVPVKTLVSTAYLQTRMQDYNPQQASVSTNIKAGNILPQKEETTHLNVVDKEGNAVAVTTTLNGSYGSYVVVGGAGFLLNNEMDDFSVKPGTANMYGLVGNEQNAIQPGKRMLSCMTPTIVLKNNQTYVVTGTPGGSTIITSVFQTLLNVLEFGLTPGEAVNAPKFHHQWFPDVIYAEQGFPQATIEALEKMGYKFVMRKGIGRTELVVIDKDGRKTAVGDHRGDDSVAGY